MLFLIPSAIRILVWMEIMLIAGLCLLGVTLSPGGFPGLGSGSLLAAALAHGGAYIPRQPSQGFRLLANAEEHGGWEHLIMDFGLHGSHDSGITGHSDGLGELPETSLIPSDSGQWNNLDDQGTRLSGLVDGSREVRKGSPNLDDGLRLRTARVPSGNKGLPSLGRRERSTGKPASSPDTRRLGPMDLPLRRDARIDTERESRPRHVVRIASCQLLHVY